MSPLPETQLVWKGKIEPSSVDSGKAAKNRRWEKPAEEGGKTQVREEKEININSCVTSPLRKKGHR